MKITLYQPTLSLLLLLLLCGGCAVNQEKGKTITPQAPPLAEIVPWQMVERVTILKANQDPIYALAISPDNSLLLSGSFDGTVQGMGPKNPKTSQDLATRRYCQCYPI
jgi:WD40 repeat protein